MNFLIALFTIILLMVSLFMVLIILMQKAKSDGGLGAAMGGGAAESAFGAETNTVLRKATIYCSVIFFVLSFAIYLAHQHQRYQADRPLRGLEQLTPAEEAEEAGDADMEGAFPDVPGGEIPEEMEIPGADEPGAGAIDEAESQDSDPGPVGD